MDAADRVLVDSSAWIDYFAGDERVKRSLDRLMDEGRVVVSGQVKQEVLQGARDERSWIVLQREMGTWSYEAETPADFVEAGHVFARLRWKGITLPASDCLIASVAKRCGCLIYATDPDFGRIPGVRLADK